MDFEHNTATGGDSESSPLGKEDNYVLCMGEKLCIKVWWTKECSMVETESCPPEICICPSILWSCCQLLAAQPGPALHRFCLVRSSQWLILTKRIWEEEIIYSSCKSRSSNLYFDNSFTSSWWTWRWPPYAVTNTSHVLKGVEPLSPWTSKELTK